MKRTTLFLIVLLALSVMTGCVNEPPPQIMPTVDARIDAIVSRVQEQTQTGESLQDTLGNLSQDSSSMQTTIDDLEATIAAQQTVINQAIETANEAVENANEAVENANAIVNAETNRVDLPLESLLRDLYDQINPSVVFISIQRSNGQPIGNGSGWVYDDNGHIVTNNHVVEDASRLVVAFADGTIQSAEVVGRDVDSDLAVIRVDSLPNDARPLPLSTLNDVDTGQFVIALGSPFGESGSLSFGIVSGLGRSLPSDRGYQLPLVIQTDAPINPGNSGGPLLNLNGEVVGVNSAIATTSGQGSGVGFSIPVDAVARIAPELITNGRYTYPYMGVSFGQLTAAAYASIGLEGSQAPVISNFVSNSPSQQAGLQVRDVIVEMDGRKINTFEDLNSYLVLNSAVGQTIDMVINRDGELLEIPVTLGARP